MNSIRQQKKVKLYLLEEINMEWKKLVKTYLKEERAKFGFESGAKNIDLTKKELHKCEVCKEAKPDVKYINDPLGYEDELDVETGKEAKKMWLCKDCAGERFSRQ